MRVAVRVAGFGEEGVVRREQFEHADVGRGRFLGGHVLDRFEAGESNELGGHLTVVEVAPVIADGAVDFEVVVESREVVVGAVTGSGMHAARAAFGGHVVGQHDGGGAINEGVTGREMFECFAFDGVNDRGSGLDLRGGEHGRK